MVRASSLLAPHFLAVCTLYISEDHNSMIPQVHLEGFGKMTVTCLPSQHAVQLLAIKQMVFKQLDTLCNDDAIPVGRPNRFTDVWIEGKKVSSCRIVQEQGCEGC